MLDACCLPPLLLAAPPDWAALGRLHPLLVHFPIALLLVAAATEAWRRLRGRAAGPSPAAVTMTAWAVPLAAAAVLLGWGVAEADFGGRDLARVLGPDPDLPDPMLDRLLVHRALGVAVVLLAALAAGAGVLARRSRRHRGTRAWRALLATAAILVVVTGHLGGELVRGPGWAAGVLRAAFTAMHGPGR